MELHAQGAAKVADASQVLLTIEQHMSKLEALRDRRRHRERAPEGGERMTRLPEKPDLSSAPTRRSAGG